jgi:hypothetical protein
VEFRWWVTELLGTQGIVPQGPTLGRWAGWAVACSQEAISWLPGVHREPRISFSDMALRGQEVTVSDRRAREELGYEPVISRRQGPEASRESARLQGLLSSPTGESRGGSQEPCG